VILLDIDHLTVLKSKSLLPLFLSVFGHPHTVEVAGANPAPLDEMRQITVFANVRAGSARNENDREFSPDALDGSK
jgi:hypothetical protein